MPLFLWFGGKIDIRMDNALLICMVGAFRFVSTTTFIRACQQSKVSKIAFVNYLQSPIGYLFDFLYFNYAINCSDIFLIVLVLVASGLMYYRAHTDSVRDTRI